MRESEFQRMLIEMLEADGATVLNVHGHGMQAAGWPDLQVYSRRWTGHLELKVKRVSRQVPLQRSRMIRLLDVGTPAWFALLGEGGMGIYDPRVITARTSVGKVPVKVIPLSSDILRELASVKV